MELSRARLVHIHATLELKRIVHRRTVRVVFTNTASCSHSHRQNLHSMPSGRTQLRRYVPSSPTPIRLNIHEESSTAAELLADSILTVERDGDRPARELPRIHPRCTSPYLVERPNGSCALHRRLQNLLDREQLSAVCSHSTGNYESATATCWPKR